MNNSADAPFNKLLDMLKGNTPKELNNMLNHLGISKEKVINQINSINQEDFLKMLSNQEITKVIENLTPEEKEKFKNLDLSNKDEIEQMYKIFKKAEETL